MSYSMQPLSLYVDPLLRPRHPNLNLNAILRRRLVFFNTSLSPRCRLCMPIGDTCTANSSVHGTGLFAARALPARHALGAFDGVRLTSLLPSLLTLWLLRPRQLPLAVAFRLLSEHLFCVSHRMRQIHVGRVPSQMAERRALPSCGHWRQRVFNNEAVAKTIRILNAEHATQLERRCRAVVSALHPTLLRKVDKPRYASAATSLCRRLRQSTPSTARVVSRRLARETRRRAPWLQRTRLRGAV